jgi:hypothetical protein
MQSRPRFYGAGLSVERIKNQRSCLLLSVLLLHLQPSSMGNPWVTWHLSLYQHESVAIYGKDQRFLFCHVVQR